MGNNKPSYLYNPELCPCAKGAGKECPRFRSCAVCIENHRSEGKIQQTACERKATLIVYYSLEGNTDFAAKEIAKVLGYETLRLEPVKKYPEKGPLKFLVGGKGACLAETPRLKPYVFSGLLSKKMTFRERRSPHSHARAEPARRRHSAS